MKKNILLTVVTSFFLFGFSSVWAVGETEFDKGISFFKHADYHAALIHFLTAQEEGMKAPKLDYNIGVCQYKLGLYDQARKSFLSAARHQPMRALAHYNVGLVTQAENRPDEAKVWFRKAYDETDNRKLKRLAGRQLGLNAGPGQTASSRPWFAGFSAEVGYDDNIQDPTLGSAANKGDSYASLLLYASGQLQGDYKNGIRLGANGYFIRYQDVTAYNIGLLQFNLDKMFLLGKWQNAARLGLDRTTLGSNDYLQSAKLSLAGTRALSLRDSLRLRYRYSDITSLKAIYDKLEGTRQEAEVRWQRKLENARIRAIYEYEFNDRKDLKSTTTFTSYSPTRNTFELLASYALNARWEIKGRLSLRNSHYNDPDLLSSGRSVTRDDQRVLAGVKLKRRLTKALKLTLGYKYTDNNSNISIHDYTRNLYSIGISGAI